jgi:hypothetical protein
MFRFPQPQETELDRVIADLREQMVGVSADSDEYAEMTKNFVKIYAMKADERPKRVSPDTVLLVTGNLLGILMIVGHERAHVITSKAIGFIGKAR